MDVHRENTDFREVDFLSPYNFNIFIDTFGKMASWQNDLAPMINRQALTRSKDDTECLGILVAGYDHGPDQGLG